MFVTIIFFLHHLRRVAEMQLHGKRK